MKGETIMSTVEHETLLSIFTECRALGDTVPKAISNTLAPRQRVGWAIWRTGERVGKMICDVGDKLTGGCARGSYRP
jgi:hypothetical protein